jgi:endonuclease YncB( thermonuclease family)
MKKLTSALTIVIIALILGLSNDSFAEIYKVKEITKVYDGDTFSCIIEFSPFDIFIIAKIRLDGLNCPEVHTTDNREKELGLVAKQFTEDFLKQDKIIVNIRTTDKYNRYLAEVFVNGKSLNKALLKAGLARVYHGERRKGWFEDGQRP